jgi:hypothetical protein
MERGDGGGAARGDEAFGVKALRHPFGTYWEQRDFWTESRFTRDFSLLPPQSHFDPSP